MNQELSPEKHHYAVIMAGGAGTRFWPLSRAARPKQLLPLVGEHSLLRSTLERISPIVATERTFIVTSQKLVDAIAADLPELPRENILAEPVGRNTAPCVGWAAAHIRKSDPNAVLAVLPSDHHVGDEAAYSDTLRRALAAASDGDLVTVGITPNRPETGYGYIEVGERVGPGVHRARRFVEKPNRERAVRFLAAGNFLWNSGMFFFRASSVLDAIRAHLPGLSQVLERYEQAPSLEAELAEVRATYGDLPSVSIDHGVMEKVERVSVLPADFGWSDLGSWMTAWELSSKDPNGNSASESVVMLDAAGCYVQVHGEKIVALIGVKDLVIVDTEDALLIAPRERSQEVKDIVAELHAKNRSRHL